MKLNRLLLGTLEWFCNKQIEPPPLDKLEKILADTVSTFEKELRRSFVQKLSDPIKRRLDALLLPEKVGDIQPEVGRAVLTKLYSDSGRLSVESILTELEKLQTIRNVSLPDDALADFSPQLLSSYKQQVIVKELYELRRHPDDIRYTLLSAYCFLRGRELTDDLVSLLIGMVHKIGKRAEKRVETEYIADIKRIFGKSGILYKVADAALENPDGVVREVIFPVVGEATLKAIVEEWKASGPAYHKKVRTIMRQTYSSHYRRVLPHLFEALEFRSNNDMHRPVLDALVLVRKYIESKKQFYPPEEDVPIEGVVKTKWLEAVVEKDSEGKTRVNRINYEMCVLQSLREQLRCKEIWVVGADRYRNPDDDLPKDFEEKRESYYEALHIPSQTEEFIEGLKGELRESLSMLNDGLPEDKHVKFLKQDGGRISLSSLKPQAEPHTIEELKREIVGRWPLTSLLDILKETDLRVGFTNLFRTVRSQERIDRSITQRRLLLCLYGLGTNAGLKRMSNADASISYKDLWHTKSRFITKEHLRAAIARVVDATFQARMESVWGQATTSCASDSKHFSAWDQNLMVEWSRRHGGRGVMIYWHVEKGSSCIHSQLKTPSSSKVASMIKGVLRHCTSMEVMKQYVDSHGQSEVGFAFCHFLGFDLLPRLKRLRKQKLYRADSANQYDNLSPIITRAANFDILGHQYDQMAKYSTALRLGTAEPESILKRFTRHNVQHPTYKALVELGRIKKTIFLCRYLHDIELRREIQEGLNVNERWNGVNDFILYGRGGEIASNRREQQELTMLALHLLQVSMVYINTLMIQEVLSQPEWRDRLSPEDRRALTPLIHLHINPYGNFMLDMETRIRLSELGMALQ